MLPAKSDEEVIQKMCIINGLCYEKIAQEGSNTTSLELFFSGYPRMVGLSLFSNLCQLTIVNQNVELIQGLECCPLLSELWIAECHLTEISGLQSCSQLEKLYLYSNQISEIKNLDMLENLQVLWLSNNCISTIQGLDTLQNLEELNLADNNIKKIGHSLKSNVNLHNLNLSGNKISSFKELIMLTNLPHLADLALQEKMSTPNPVCQLSNYATHVLYHMPGLQRLDNYIVSNRKIKEAAESAVLKKLMYYNMRVRNAQRNLAETQSSLREKKKALLQIPEESVRTLSHSLKSLEQELSKATVCHESSTDLFEDEEGRPLDPEDRITENCDSTTDSATENKFQLKIEAIKERLKLWTSRMERIEALYKQDLALAENRLDSLVEFLLMELESVGNIRLEEGSSADVWFSSCRDLLLSRFCPSDYKIKSIKDIQINRVVRIHNNALRHRFEHKMHSLFVGEDSVIHSKNRLEYLFYTPDPERCEKEEALCIAKEGFKTTQQLKAFGGEGVIPLSNVLSVAEEPRIEYALRQAGQSGSKHPIDSVPFRHGEVIVSKVYVGNSTPIREGTPLDTDSYHKVCSVYRNMDTKYAANEDESCSTKMQECNLRRRQWFLFDHELILPEYIIYFEYITGDEEPHSLLSHDADREASLSHDVTVDQSVLDMEPTLQPQPKLLSLDDLTQVDVLSQITVLNLHNSNLTKIKEISILSSLRHLTISFNEFTHLADVSHMPSLEILDASFNHLVSLDGLQRLRNLKQLDVRWNKLTKAKEDTAVLRKHTPALLRLDVRYNPWNTECDVMRRMMILSQLTTLTHLDDVLVSQEEAAQAAKKAAGSEINQVSLLVHGRTDVERPRCLSLMSTAQLLHCVSPAPWSLGEELEPDWSAMITTLNLDNQRITKMTNLTELVNLRWASFNNNNISKVEGLDRCLNLQELSLNDNSISTLSGLPRLHYLNKLSADRNTLTCLETPILGELPNLSFLSLEGNRVSSLHGIHRLRSLLELYISDNQISTTRDIYYMKGLTNLIILDLYGNPLMEQLENYRIYAVFHIPTLKALDGVAVEMAERDRARIVFTGRLLPDTIAEKLGHTHYQEITKLSMPSCSIRTVDLTPTDLFSNLHSVTLDHNNLTSFSGLVKLPNIKILSLNHNRIESIFPKKKAHLTKRQILHNKVHSSGYGKQNLSKFNRDTGPAVSLEPLMGSLEVLHLSHNGISDLIELQLSRLSNLKALFLQGNEITQVEGLEGLHHLRELVLDRNWIKVLSRNSFAAQKVLRELHMAENRIQELDHLESLTELRKLFLGKNKIQDITELEKLDVLPLLTELCVIGNPVAKKSLHRPSVVLQLTRLQVLDGDEITPEERETQTSLFDTLEPGAVFPPPSLINHPGPQTITSHNCTVRGMRIIGQGQIPMYALNTTPSSKLKYITVAQGVQPDPYFQQNRTTGSRPSTIGLPSHANRFTGASSKHEQNSRFPKTFKPPFL
ncbi:leucine-rich repeat-containing protein 9 isoform X2 [Gouania willdenowi]|uniref:Leucine-rich repeat-containing protein 9 n=4 Tax=Gouania willdenowi TaxID=441366 RepID=A0A8C5DW76_GOUWI|nr:leucine-rich repeat-containing protein 9 isoform X2 [Gouania willdenowi]